MLDAFIKQTYGSYTNAQEADEQATIREQQELEMQENYYKMAIIEMYKDQSIQSSMSIPTKIKDGQLNQTPEVHPNLKNYKHDLELDRTPIVRAKYLENKYKDNLENMPSEIDFKHQDSSDVGSVGEMFDNIFDD